MIFELSKTNSIANTYVAELRDETIQKDAMRFRHNLERIAAYFALEISKSMDYEQINVQTSLGMAPAVKLKEQPVLATILRAGLPMQQGLIQVFDRAPSAFITAYRKTHDNGTPEIMVDYVSTPDLTGKTLIMADPMLATGLSMVLCCKELLKRFKIKELHLVIAIASAAGVAYVREHLPEAKLWIGAVDADLDARSYIVPGLGDAGDLAYGKKL